MRNKVIMIAALAGLCLAVVSALLFGEQPHAQPPLFRPTANPFGNGIYAEGMIESRQGQGENVSIYPEVAGPITQVAVREGQHVSRGELLLGIDDSVQRATAGQLRAQAEAARALLAELKAEPRPETLAVAAAQVQNAEASLRSAHDSAAKQQRSFDLDPRSVSRDALDSSHNAEQVAATNLAVVRRQYELVKAGAWQYDIQNQQRQAEALAKAAESAEALLAKYTLRAPIDGQVLTIAATVGSTVTTQGAYDAYTQGYVPLLVMSTPQGRLQVRAFIDEILIDRLPDPAHLRATMTMRGTTQQVPLTFERIQPYVSPKIELSDQRAERVDVRVLPVIFSFDNAAALHAYPGELVDVYVGQ